MVLLYEFEGKKILAKYGLPIPRSIIIKKGEVSGKIEHIRYPVMVKAQIFGGHRGKRGLVKKAENKEEAEKYIAEIFGRRDIPEGQVEIIMLEEVIEAEREIYIALMPDRATRRILVMISGEGGIDIENKAAEGAIIRFYMDVGSEGYAFEFFDKIKAAGVNGPIAGRLAALISDLFGILKKEDLLLLEINPLLITPEGRLYIADARIITDDSALYRHRDTAEFESVKKKRSGKSGEAAARGLAYVELGGDIGLVSCGAGLSMATCDMIKEFGGEPADFLDVGGGATPERVEAALDILFSDPDIRGILINVFGGITRCDEVARGIVRALKKNPESPPVIVRLMGTNDKEGVDILNSEGIEAYTDMDEAVKRILELVKNGYSDK